MQRPRYLVWKRLGWGTVLSVSIILVVMWVNFLINTDPLARLRSMPEDAIGTQIGFRLEGVTLKHYKGEQLVTHATVGRIDVRQDRQYFDLYNVTDGVHYDGDEEIRFAAETASWSSPRRTLEVLSGAQVATDDFDLNVSTFLIDDMNHQIVVPGEIKGPFYDGEIVATSLTYNLTDGSYIVGPAAWVGNLDPEARAQAGSTRTKWSISTEAESYRRGDIETWNEATATDGEVLIKAPKIERDVKTDVLTATGRVLYFSEKANVAADVVVVDRKAKKATLTGNIQMIFKPKDEQTKKLEVVEIPPMQPIVPEEIAKARPAPARTEEERQRDEDVRSPKTLRKYPVSMTAAKVEYWYEKGKRRAIITGSPQARQELLNGRWRHVWTHKALYDGEKELLRMVSTEGTKDTRVKTSIGDDLVAEWFEISTKEDVEAWTAKGLEGDVYVDEDREGEPNSGSEESEPPLSGPIGNRPPVSN